MVNTSVMRTLSIVFLIICLTACSATNSSNGEPLLSPGNEVLTEPLVGIHYFLENPIEQLTNKEPGASLFERVAKAPQFVDQQIFIDLYQQVSPSVVSIQAVSTPDEPDLNELFTPTFPQIPGLPPTIFDETPPMTPMPQHSQGSGFVYDDEGHIITNRHIVDNAIEITVTFANGTEVPAIVVGTDPVVDLAVLKVETSTDLLQPIKFGESDSLKIGQFIVAIGNPFGLEGSITTGIISGLGPLLPVADWQGVSTPDMIQTDAAITPRTSGGPLLNLDGEVIGVNTVGQSTDPDYTGLYYAVPANTVSKKIPDLIENGRREHPWLDSTARYA